MESNKARDLIDKLYEKCLKSKYRYEQYKIRGVIATILAFIEYDLSCEPVSADAFLYKILEMGYEGE